jgi:DNA-binding NarL/FixJ family response regulator
MRSSRILLADDHALFRQGIRLILDEQPDLEVVAEAGDGAEALKALQDADVDLAILDVSMPRLTGLQLARQIRRQHPNIKILMLSMYDNEQYFLEALKVGASGYVLKSVADHDLVEACRAAIRNEPFVYPRAESMLVKEYLRMHRAGIPAPEAILTPREEEVAKLIAEGHTSADIAELLVISPKTVESHRSNILSKLGMRDRVELTRYAIRAGLIEP